MDVQNSILKMPGKLKTTIFAINTQQDIEDLKMKTIEDQQSKKLKEQSNAIIHQELNPKIEFLMRMGQVQPKLSKKPWDRKIPMWNHKDDKDEQKKKNFAEQIQKIKSSLGDPFEKQKQLRQMMYQDIAKPQPSQQQLQYQAAKQAASNDVQSDQQLKQQHPVNPIDINPRDVYCSSIKISNLLQLFLQTYQYNCSTSAYINQFPDLQKTQNEIMVVTTETHKQKLTYKKYTVEGQLRAKQFARADMFNQRLKSSYDQMLGFCSGTMYIPDSYFTTQYKLLPKEIQKILTIQLMQDKKEKPLFEMIGCGESVNYLTFETEEFKRYIDKIQSQYKEFNSWEPYKFYKQAFEYKKTRPKCKGVTAQYKRCGYEKFLMINAESILLYFVFKLAMEQNGNPEVNPNEFIILKDKIQDCIINFDKFNQKCKKNNDELWAKVQEFVGIRTGGIKVEKVKYEDDEIPAQDAKADQQNQVQGQNQDVVFQYGGYTLNYQTGQVINEAEVQRKLEEEARIQKELEKKEQQRIEQEETERKIQEIQQNSIDEVKRLIEKELLKNQQENEGKDQQEIKEQQKQNASSNEAMQENNDEVARENNLENLGKIDQDVLQNSKSNEEKQNKNQDQEQLQNSKQSETTVVFQPTVEQQSVQKSDDQSVEKADAKPQSIQDFVKTTPNAIADDLNVKAGSDSQVTKSLQNEKLETGNLKEENVEKDSKQTNVTFKQETFESVQLNSVQQAEQFPTQSLKPEATENINESQTQPKELKSVLPPPDLSMSQPSNPDVQNILNQPSKSPELPPIVSMTDLAQRPEQSGVVSEKKEKKKHKKQDGDKSMEETGVVVGQATDSMTVKQGDDLPPELPPDQPPTDTVTLPNPFSVTAQDNQQADLPPIEQIEALNESSESRSSENGEKKRKKKAKKDK